MTDAVPFKQPLMEFRTPWDPVPPEAPRTSPGTAAGGIAPMALSPPGGQRPRRDGCSLRRGGVRIRHPPVGVGVRPGRGECLQSRYSAVACATSLATRPGVVLRATCDPRLCRASHPGRHRRTCWHRPYAIGKPATWFHRPCRNRARQRVGPEPALCRGHIPRRGVGAPGKSAAGSLT